MGFVGIGSKAGLALGKGLAKASTAKVPSITLAKVGAAAGKTVLFAGKTVFVTVKVAGAVVIGAAASQMLLDDPQISTDTMHWYHAEGNHLAKYLSDYVGGWR